MSRTKQGGSVLGFLIIGSVLVLLLVGGVYVVRHYWAPVAETAKVAGPATSSDKSTGNNQSNNSSNSGNPSTPAPQPSTPAQSPAVTSPSVPQQPVAPTPAPAKLPTTGPADTLMSVLVLGALTAAATAYAQSLRHRATL